MKLLAALVGNKLGLGVGGWVWHYLEILGWALSLFPSTAASGSKILPLSPFLHWLLPLSSPLFLSPYQQKKTCPDLCWPSSNLSLQQEEEVQSPAVRLCRAVHTAVGYTQAPCKKNSLGPAMPQCSCLGSNWGLKGNRLLCGVKRNYGQREGDSFIGHFGSFWGGC